jgi:PAS domain S-box-containing protein
MNLYQKGETTETSPNYEMALRASGMGTWEWDLLSNSVYWSDKVFEIFGLAKGDFQNDYESYFNLVHPEDRKLVESKVEDALKSGSEYRVEHRIIQPSGNIIWIEGVGNFILDSDGKKIKMMGVVWDITELKTASLKAKSLDKLFATLATSIRELFINAVEDWDSSIDRSLKLLGQTTGVDRVYLFENDVTAPGDEPSASQRYEWNSGVAEAQINNPELQHLPYTHMEPLYEYLSVGKPYSAIVRAMPELSVKKILQEQDILSILIFPIFIRNKFWGFIGFDECKYERQWTDTEYSALRAFSSTVSAALERKQYQHDLQASEIGYKGLFNTVGEAIYIQEPNGKFITVNDHACEMYGYVREEFIGKTPDFLSAPGKNNLDALRHMFEKAFSGEQQVFEWWGQRKDGTILLKEVRLSRGLYFGKDVLIATAIDITERKKSEEALRESEQRFRVLQQASFGGIGLHSKGIILDCNQGLSDITGYTQQELIGMNGLELIAPEYRDLVMTNILSGYEKPYDVEGIKKDGTRYSLEIHGKNMPYKGDIIRVTEFRNITERKQTESKIIEQNLKLSSIAEELKRKNDQLEEFTQIVSHNLRSPVGNILSLITLFEQAQTEEEKTELMRFLKDSGKMTMTTLTELNEVLKVKQNQNIERQNLQFAEVLQNVTLMLHAEIIKLSATITTDFKAAPVIHYPRIYLESILLNLISNSLKYHHPSRKSIINVKTFVQEGSICLMVEDNGLGINLEKYSHQIFKLRKTFHLHPESRGVGLFMIKNQVETMGGKIKVTSKEQHGTTFTVIFAPNNNTWEGNP